MIPDERIFHALPAEKLPAIARCLGFDPFVEGELLSALPETRKVAWLDAHRQKLEDEFRWVGSSIFGKRKTYREIVLDTAEKIGATYSHSAATPAVEQAIVVKMWKDAVARMTDEQRAQVAAAMEELASKHGKHLGKELSGLAALGAAQLSGFGIYMLGSTLLGAVNGALGLGLGFSVFTGLSSLISVVIGPIGWATLGLLTIAKLGAPNYKKVLLVILQIAIWRAQSAAAGPAASPTASLGGEMGTSSRPAEASPRSTPPPAGYLEAAIAETTEQTKRKLDSTRPKPRRKPSAQEKRLFDLENPELSKLARELTGMHYLELSEEDQAAVREIYREQQELREEEEKRREEQMRRAREEEKQSARERSRKRKILESKRKEYRRLLPNLTFTDEALERLLALDEKRQGVTLQQFKQLDAGNIQSKHVVPQTRPHLFQRDAGSDVRIYYRIDGAPNRVLVHLIGTKSTQDADYEAMRRGA